MLKIKDMNLNNVIRQGDSQPREYQLDTGNLNLNLANKQATIRLMTGDYKGIAYETTATVSSENKISFSIDDVIPDSKYHLEVTVDDYVFPSRATDGRFDIDPSSHGQEVNIIQIIGKDEIVRDVKEQVEDGLQPFLGEISQSELDRQAQEEAREETYEKVKDLPEAFQNVIDETTGKDVISAPEIIAARRGKASLGEKIDEVDAQLAQNAYQVKNETELNEMIMLGHQSIVLKKDIVLNEPIDLDGVDIKLNLNGFKITLSDTYTADYIFSIGFNETITTPKKSKWIFGGVIDCNDKICSVMKYHYSSDFKCHNLRVLNNALGFITYYSESDLLASRGYETMFNNITIHSSELYEPDNVGFDIRFGDFYGFQLIAVSFTYGNIDRIGGNIYSHCHHWGYPNNYPKNRRMAIGFVDSGHGNKYHNCLADTPELLDVNLHPSFENGGIGYYSANSNSVRYDSCAVLLHNASTSSTLYGWFFDNVKNDGDLWYGQDVHLINCNIERVWSKLLKPIYYTGKRVINMVACNFNENGRANNYSCLDSNSTIFKNALVRSVNDLKLFELTGNNTFKIFRYKDIMTIVSKNNSGEENYIFLRPHVNNRYKELTALAKLKTQLLAEKELHGLHDRTGTVTTLLAVWDNELGKDEYNLVYWNRELGEFYYAKDNTLVELP